MTEDGSSWDMISDNDLWEGENIDSDQDFVLVRQEDIVEGIACFMAAYLLSLKQTKVCFLYALMQKAFGLQFFWLTFYLITRSMLVSFIKTCHHEDLYHLTLNYFLVC